MRNNQSVSQGTVEKLFLTNIYACFLSKFAWAAYVTVQKIYTFSGILYPASVIFRTNSSIETPIFSAPRDTP